MAYFKNWTVGKKIFLLNFFMLANMILVGLIGFKNTHQISEQLNDISHTQLPAVRNMTLVDMMHDGLRAVAYRAIIVNSLKDEKQYAEVQSEFLEFSKNINNYLVEIEKLAISSSTKAKIAEAKPKIVNYIESTKLIVDLALAQKGTEALTNLNKFQTSFEDLESELGSLGEQIEKDAQKSLVAGEALGTQANFLSLVVIIVGFLFGIILAYIITKNLLRQLNFLSKKLKTEALEVKNAAQFISTASQKLAESSAQQSVSLQETAASIEEMNAMVSKSSENSVRSKEVADLSSQIATRGHNTVEQMSVAISEIRMGNENLMKQVDESNQKISDIVKVITEIGNKTNVINDIVFQTKLLSFNASVEAARAGEHGKGFAVVAEEVGNLAQMSGNAAKEISDMLSISIKKVEDIVSETKSKVESLVFESNSKIEVGTKVAKECSEILEEIVKNTSEVNSMINEIKNAAQEQAQGVSEITKAMNLIDQSNEENVMTSHKTAESSAQLSSQSEALLDAVGTLEQLIFGNKDNNNNDLSTNNNISNEIKVTNEIELPKVQPQNVVPFHSAKAPEKQNNSEVLKKDSQEHKKVVGDSVTPSSDDPRFEDI